MLSEKTELTIKRVYPERDKDNHLYYNVFIDGNQVNRVTGVQGCEEAEEANIIETYSPLIEALNRIATCSEERLPIILPDYRAIRTSFKERGLIPE